MKKTAVAKAANDSGLEPYLLNLARQEANKVSPRKKGGPWSWTDALARAPWSEELPEAWEDAFRRAYAMRLVELGLALPVGRSRTSGPSGESTLKRRTFKATPEELDEHDARAKAAGVPWNTWVRRKLAEP